MRMYDLIQKKRNKEELSNEEIEYMINHYVSGEIPDYQMSAMLMAIFFNGMNDREISTMTNAMAKSGDMVDLSSIEGIKVDKHSTGGVGDKTTLIIAPIVAYYGVKVAKMSGRGLGHTGGTVDKMEAIPGLRTNFSQEEFFDIVNKTGISVIGQSGNLAPADKKLYALRDVTATVESIPLIASSIMSKKLAAGSDCILLDVKTGNGAFMKNLDDSISLAQKMVTIGENCGRKMVALITDMDIPLGNNIGNSLEIVEVIDTLNGKGPKDLTDLCIKLAGNMLYLANKGTIEECENMAKQAIENGYAIKKLIEMVEAQGGDIQYIKNPNKFTKSKYSLDIVLEEDVQGYINYMDTEGLGIASTMLGAGRETKEDSIDFSAGIVLNKKVGDKVKKGDILCTLYTNDYNRIENARNKVKNSIIVRENKPKEIPLVFARVEKDKLQKF
ncbi:pyrimidine-nucleoside phosphorylase [uncultured Tyzzerella sp.]|uniref:pyrimidine-nucleoside phosphorylase n=1 Tax=uncultured Tyzzerella sp. TaxID=2321398 RepID=UPI0029439540|nr:pyrimidine-nucleoside phosphorylase [uncultured Tyzzerella sp.]